VTVLVSLLAGGALFGFWGILLAIPIAAFIQLLYNDYYLASDWYQGLSHKKPKEQHGEAAD
jgi:predicted PurR-regulated permease PerM